MRKESKARLSRRLTLRKGELTPQQTQQTQHQSAPPNSTRTKFGSALGSPNIASGSKLKEDEKDDLDIILNSLENAVKKREERLADFPQSLLNQQILFQKICLVISTLFLATWQKITQTIISTSLSHSDPI